MAAQEILVLLVAVRARLPQQKTDEKSSVFFVEVKPHPLSLRDIPLKGNMPLSASLKAGGSVAPVLRTLAHSATRLQAPYRTLIVVSASAKGPGSTSDFRRLPL